MTKPNKRATGLKQKFISIDTGGHYDTPVMVMGHTDAKGIVYIDKIIPTAKVSRKRT